MKWLQVMNKASIGEIYIYGEIEDFKWIPEDVTPMDIKNELEKLKNSDSINLYVNSPGGSVFAGLAIFNELKRFEKPITAYVDGVAASIASLIVLAADRVVMPFNAMFMIHNMWTCICGTAEDLRNTADRIDKMSESILVETYARKTGLEKDKIIKMMDEETWLNGEDAFLLGFADEILEEQKIAACYKGENVSFGEVEVNLNKFKSFKKEKFTEFEPKKHLSLEQRHRHNMNMLAAHI